MQLKRQSIAPARVAIERSNDMMKGVIIEMLARGGSGSYGRQLGGTLLALYQ